MHYGFACQVWGDQCTFQKWYISNVGPVATPSHGPSYENLPHRDEPKHITHCHFYSSLVHCWSVVWENEVQWSKK